MEHKTFYQILCALACLRICACLRHTAPSLRAILSAEHSVLSAYLEVELEVVEFKVLEVEES